MVKFAETERKAGIYRAAFVEIDTDFEIKDRDSGEMVTRWRWVFQDVNDPTTVGELDTITSPGFKPRSNGRKFFTGMLGREPVETDDTDDYIGQVFDVTWGPNQSGRLTIVNVTRVIDSPAVAPVAQPAAPSRPATPQPLP